MSRTALLVAGGVVLALVGLTAVARLWPRAPSSSEADATDPSDGTAPSAAARLRARAGAADDLQTIWFESTRDASDVRDLRTRLRARMGGVQWTPEDLAQTLCAYGEFEPRGDVALELALAAWPAAQALDSFLRFDDLCSASADRWLLCLESQVRRVPRWGAVVSEALRARNPFDGSPDCRLLRVAKAFARCGDADVTDLLERGARGQCGGAEQQVAFAIETCAALRTDPAARFAFLREIASADTFPRREPEVKSLVSLALDHASASAVGGETVAAFVRELMLDPRTAEAAAARVLALEDWGCLPGELAPRTRSELLALARKLGPRTARATDVEKDCSPRAGGPRRRGGP